MGVFDTDGGPVDKSDDGPDEFEENNGDNPLRNGSAGDDDASDDDDSDDDGGDDTKDADKTKRRRQRPGIAKRQADRIKGLESQVSQLMALVQKNGLAADLPKGNQGENQTVDVEALRREIASEVESKANDRIIRTEARSALKEAGFRGNPSRGISMLDLEGIDPDDEDALLDAIEELKEDSPELFGRVRRSRSTRDDDDSEDSPRERESRPSRSRERMSRNRSNGGGETDPLANTLIRAVGGPGVDTHRE